MPFISTVSRKFAFGRSRAYYKSFQLEHTLDNPNAYDTSQNDFFGYASAVSGNYAIVGAVLEDDAGGPTSGKAYIFNATSGALLHTLDNPTAFSTSSGDRFGENVAISGNYAIVSARLEDDAGGSNSGKAYIFSVTDGSLVHTLDNPTAYSSSSGDDFGYSVDISGDRAIVGARFEDDAGGTQSGKAYIFNVTDGSLVHTLDNPNGYGTSAGDLFGISVAISGDRAIVGAYAEDYAGGNDSGKAYIFDVVTGVLVHTLDNPNVYNTSAGDQFGFSLDISGNYAIVSANREDVAGGTNSGKAYIFDVTSGNLLYTLDNPSAVSGPPGDEFGWRVAISGNYAIVSAKSEDDAGGSSSGKAYIFDVTSGNLLYTLDNPNAYSTSAEDNFGWSVAISGDRAIVGAYLEDDAGGENSGKAYIYKLSDSIQYQPQNLYALYNQNAFGPSAGDTFGQSVAISGDRAIVGAYLEDDAGGTNSGKAYIYDVTSGNLLYTLDNPNAYDTSAFDGFGTSVAIDNNYAIVSARDEDDANGFNSGKAYIFDVTSGSLVHTLDNPNAYSTSAEDIFGISVAISGNYAIVGASLEDDAGGSGSGKAYIFNVTTGALVHTLDNPNAFGTSELDFFSRVAISGDRAIVGAPGEDDAGGTSSGKAYIFNVTTGSLLYTLNNPNVNGTSQDDRFGISVAISGNYAIVGADSEDDGGQLGSGKAYIYDISTFTTSTISSATYVLDNPNAYSTRFGDKFGNSVAISGNRAIVGAYSEDDAGGINSGKAYIYNISTFTTSTISSATYVLDNPNVYDTSASDAFGWNVAISGNYAIVSATTEDDAGGSGSGAAYVFELP